MSNDHPSADPVSHYFAAMQEQIKEHHLDYLFLSIRQFIEQEHKLRVIVEIHSDVPAGSAIGALTTSGNTFCIFVSREDVEHNPDMLRLRVAHELGHVVCGHVREGQYLSDHGLGDSGIPNSRYDQWRHTIEDEADVFSLNMFYAHGQVVERHIPSEQEYETKIGPLFFDVRPPGSPRRPSLLNEADFRKHVFRSLRQEGFVHPPLAILCHALVEVFGKEFLPSNGSDLHRRTSAERIHLAYRTRLSALEAKPPSHHCESCLDCHKSHCFD